MATTNKLTTADELLRLPVDYGCIGGIFATMSKNNPAAPIGLDGLTSIAAHVRSVSNMPVGAIAGIDASNADAVITSGVDGIAIISALFMAPDPQAEAQRLRQIVDQSLASRGTRA